MVLFGTKVPLPDEIHAPVFVGPDTLPLSPTFTLLIHVTWSAPAFTAGAGVMVISILSVTGRQVPFPVVVSMSVALPAVISEAEGV